MLLLFINDNHLIMRFVAYYLIGFLLKKKKYVDIGNYVHALVYNLFFTHRPQLNIWKVFILSWKIRF